MPRGPRGEEQQRIFLAHRVRFLHFAKQAVSISELRFEFSPDFFSNLITAAVNPGPDRHLEIPWPAAKTANHLAHAFLDDAFYRAAPTCVEDADRVTLAIDNDHRQAISRLDRKQDAGIRCNHAIPDTWSAGQALDVVDDVGMNLAQRNKGPQRRAFSGACHRPEFPEKHGAVTLHRVARVVFRKTEIEIILAVNPRIAPHARGEGMHEPGQFRETRRTQKRDSGLLGRNSQHASIIKDIPIPLRSTCLPGCAGVRYDRDYV